MWLGDHRADAETLTHNVVCLFWVMVCVVIHWRVSVCFDILMLGLFVCGVVGAI